MTLFHQTSYGSREEGNDWTGNSVYLHAVANAAYMAMMGPEGFAELGRLVIGRSHYAARRLAAIEGVSVLAQAGFFKEFVVGFDGTGKTVTEVNRQLRAHGIFGGIDLSTSSRSSDRAPSTASPRCTNKPISTGSPPPSRRCSREHSAVSTRPRGTSHS